MGTTKSYTAFTGTFTTQSGAVRTMTFIRNQDIPLSVLGSGRKSLTEGAELVFDVEKDALRTFNWNTVQGEVTDRTISYSFDRKYSQR